jgi:hypothetical protein
MLRCFSSNVSVCKIVPNVQKAYVDMTECSNVSRFLNRQKVAEQHFLAICGFPVNNF